MDLDLTDRVYVVTGGARGLGRATADVLVAEGARVVLSGRSQESLDDAVAALGSVGGRGRRPTTPTPPRPARVIAAALDTWGRLDGALVSVGGPPQGRLAEITDEQWSASFESVFLGAVRLAREVVDRLGEGGSLAFVLSSTVRSPIGTLAISNGLRPGLAMVAKALADEVGPRGIRVNGLLPGSVLTERLTSLLEGTGDPERAHADGVAGIPLGRYGEPAEFGRAAAFLLSPASSYLSGVMLPVDGGASRSL